MPFLTELYLQKVRGEDRLFLVTSPLLYISRVGDLITVPDGTPTDFASIPRVFWRLWPPTGRYSDAAVVHDYLYRSGLFDRATCDRIFLEAMEDSGVSLVTRQALYRGVRIGGWLAYNQYRKGKKDD